MKVLMISTDQVMLKQGSAVRERIFGYSGLVEELSVVILGVVAPQETIGNLRLVGKTRWQALWWRPTTKFDLVTSQDPFETGLIARLIARRLRAKLQLQVHTDFLSPGFIGLNWRHKFQVRLAGFLLPRADSVRVVSQKIKDSLIAKNFKLKSDPIVLPIYVDIDRLRSEPIRTDLHKKYPQYTKIVLVASRLTKEKNVGLAVEAMGKVVRSRPKTGLIVVGSGPQEHQLKKNAGPNVVFEPWSNDLPSYYKTADLFLNTSWYEGYGMAIIEALACGCPVVSTDVGVAKMAGAVIAAAEDLPMTIERVLDNGERGRLLLEVGDKNQYLQSYASSLNT